MVHESQMHKCSSFLTLTYDDAHLPDYGQLLKSDLQKALKRARHVLGPLRYVACGEYGDRTRRPHFHVALFGHDFADDRLFAGTGKGGSPLYESATVRKFWKFGLHRIGDLTFESAGYIARYVTKKISGVGASATPLALLDDGEIIFPNPEFLVCSRRPFIGATWLQKFGRSDVESFARVISPDGVSLPVPRAYKKAIGASRPKAMDLQFKMLGRVEKHLEKMQFEDKPVRRAARNNYALSRQLDLDKGKVL